MRHLALASCLVALPVFAADPMPPAAVRLKVNGAVVENGGKISGRPGEKLSLEAKVFGARRAWCMEPARYANMGRNTVIQTSGEDGLSFTTGPGFNGVWKLQSETAAWYGQLGDDTVAAPKGNTALVTVPAKPGTYSLQVKAAATWHYDRHSQGNHVEQVEKNEAEGNYTLVVEQAEGTWFSSANITASGSQDDDVRFRLQSLQQRFDLISQQVLDGQFALAEQNVAGLGETLGTIKSRLEQLKKEKPGFACTITFIGSPVDKGMKRVAALKTLAEQWKRMHQLVTGNAQSINTLLLNTQMVFSNNILKSVVKNYLDWGSGIPGVGDFFGSVPVNLQALLIPANVMDWYGNAEEDANILKNQALAIKRMSELREFYLQRGSDFVEESRKIHADLDKNKPVLALDAKARGLLSGSGFAKWRP